MTPSRRVTSSQLNCAEDLRQCRGGRVGRRGGGYAADTGRRYSALPGSRLKFSRVDCLDNVSMLLSRMMERTPAELGYRMPAEWEQHEAKNGVALRLLTKSAGVTDGTKPKAH